MKKCELCGKSVEKFQRKYKGKGYCSTCYAYLFKKNKCTKCGEDKRIYRYLQPPACQRCELKGQPCIRCGKAKFSLGKIIEDGPVCNSCSKYYRPKKSCSICGKKVNNVSKRLKHAETKPICDKCFNKKHFVSCFRCKQRAAPFLFDFKRNAYCKPCATKPDKNCIKCGAILPAGHHSNTCYDCHALAKLQRILRQRKEEICQQTHQLYQNYSNWLLDRREPRFTSRQIIRDYEIFVFLDEWFTKNSEWPIYKEFANALTIQKTRKHLLTTTFLDDWKIFSVDEKIKAEIGDLNTINRLLEKIPTESALRHYLDGYYTEMLDRYNQGKTSARSFRLALTPVVAMLKLGLKQDKTSPDNELIKQYLWLHYGQRAAITGFINFLKNEMAVGIEMPKSKYFKFTRPAESKARIKQQFISLLRSNDYNQAQYIIMAVEYFHNIKFPTELSKLEKIPFKQSNDISSLKLAGQILFFPSKVPSVFGP